MIAEKVKYKLRFASTDDADLLRAAYGEMLRWIDKQGYHLLPTDHNINWAYHHIFEPAMIAPGHRHSILIAETDDGEFAAALFWVLDESPLQERFLKGTSYGQWVQPEHRGNGLVGRMVRRATENFRALGVKQVYDMIHVESAREAAEAAGFHVAEKVVILEL